MDALRASRLLFIARACRSLAMDYLSGRAVPPQTGECWYQGQPVSAFGAALARSGLSQNLAYNIADDDAALVQAVGCAFDDIPQDVFDVLERLTDINDKSEFTDRRRNTAPLLRRLADALDAAAATSATEARA